MALMNDPQVPAPELSHSTRGEKHPVLFVVSPSPPYMDRLSKYSFVWHSSAVSFFKF